MAETRNEGMSSKTPGCTMRLKNPKQTLSTQLELSYPNIHEIISKTGWTVSKKRGSGNFSLGGKADTFVIVINSRRDLFFSRGRFEK